MSKTDIKYLFLIIVIFIAACIETDIYLPAFPDMMIYFSTTEGEIQSLLTWNFLGICISGPFYGPLSDSFGRKKPLIIALGMFLLGSCMTLLAQDFDQMLWGRVLQGLGSGGCFTLGTAIIFDAFKANKAIQALNQLNSTIPFIMAGAPMVGGYLNHMYGFRSNFLAIFLFVLVSFIVCLFFFDETLAKEKRTPFKVKKIINDFTLAFTSVAFWQLTTITSLLFAGYLVFLSVTAVLFVVEFHVSKTLFPFYQAAVLGGWVVASFTCNRALAKWGSQKIKKIGTAITMIGGVGFILSALLFSNDPNILTSGMVLYGFGCNWMISLYFPESMEILPDIRGVTASLLTSARLLITALIVGLAGILYNATIYPLMFLMAVIIVAVLSTVFAYERKKQYSTSNVNSLSSETHSFL